MKTTRMWIAAPGFLAPWSILMFIASADSDVTATGQVSGRVTYNGRPLQGGTIYFDPIEGNSGDRAAGLIDENGVYSMDSHWRRPAGPAKFRMSVIPDPWKPSASSPSRSEGPRPKAKDVVASPNPENSDARRLAAVAAPIPERFTEVRTSGLQVILDRGPARVDIDLKD